jgi:hypothetical protein
LLNIINHVCNKKRSSSRNDMYSFNKHIEKWWF